MSKKRELSDEEKELWKAVASTISPIARKKRVASKNPKPRKITSHKNFSGFEVSLENEIYYSKKLDLHGMSLEKAHKTLLGFIKQHAKFGSRKLLIITGKGSGALRSELPLWLETESLQKLVSSCKVAPIEQGGDCAFIVMLKKKHES